MTNEQLSDPLCGCATDCQRDSGLIVVFAILVVAAVLIGVCLR